MSNKQAAKVYMGPQKKEAPKRENTPEVVDVPEGKQYPRDVYIVRPNNAKISDLAGKILELVKDIHFGDDALKESARNELVKLIVIDAGATVNNAESFVTKILRKDLADSEGSGEIKFEEYLGSELDNMISHTPSTRFDTRKDKSTDKVGPAIQTYPRTQDDSPAELAFIFAPKFVALSQKTGDTYRNALIGIVNEIASATAIPHESVSRFIDRMLKRKKDSERGLAYFEPYLLSAFRRLMRSQEVRMAFPKLNKIASKLVAVSDKLDHAGKTHLANLVDEAIKELTNTDTKEPTRDSSGASSEEDFGDELDRRSLRDIPDPAQVEFDQEPTDKEVEQLWEEEANNE